MEDRSTIVPSAANTQPAPEQPIAQEVRPAQNQPQNIAPTSEPITTQPSTPPAQQPTTASATPPSASHFPKLIIVVLAVINLLILSYIIFMLVSR